jgi:hypothetical protein
MLPLGAAQRRALAVVHRRPAVHLRELLLPALLALELLLRLLRLWLRWGGWRWRAARSVQRRDPRSALRDAPSDGRRAAGENGEDGCAFARAIRACIGVSSFARRRLEDGIGVEGVVEGAGGGPGGSGTKSSSAGGGIS